MRGFFFEPRYPRWLLGVYAVYWLFWAYRPLMLQDWALENVLVVFWLGFLLVTYRRFPLSNVSYTLIFLHLCLHTVGAHYTYEQVPYDEWFRSLFGTGLNEWFGFTRNHFDRLVHFCFGLLLAYPIREVFLRVAAVRGFWGYYLPLDVTMAFSMLFELLEWAAALIFGGDLAQAYLGTQGDIWDAHWDMALASLGAVIAMSVVAFLNWKFQTRFGEEWWQSLAVKEQLPLGEVKLREMLRRRRDDN